MPSPLSPAGLREVLQWCDVVRSQCLVNSFSAGFEIGCLGVPVQEGEGVKNMRSAFEFPQLIDMRLRKQLALWRMLDPFDVPPTDPAYRIPPGVVPKKVPGEFRVIHNLSQSEGSSVNDYIPRQLSSVHYATIQFPLLRNRINNFHG